jgi:hypothetical protein
MPAVAFLGALALSTTILGAIGVRTFARRTVT